MYRFKTSEAVELPLTTQALPGTVEIVKQELKKQLPPRLLIPNNCIHRLQIIGHGEFGEVHKALLIKQRGTGVPHVVAVKTLKGLLTQNDVQQVMKEVLKMQDFKHPRVMSLLGVCLEFGVGIVMPYMANGSVLDYLKREKAALLLGEKAELEEMLPVRSLLLRMCLQIAEGMEYLAGQKFVHRGLAARNCMLDSKGNVKVGDFGLAEGIYSIGYVRDPTKTVKVPFKRMAPESLEEGLFSEKSDVWSYGVTCWEVFTVGKIPYPAVDPPTLLRMVKEGYRLECPANPACPTQLYAVMKKCWRMLPAERPRFTVLVVLLEKMLATLTAYVELIAAVKTSETEALYEEIGPSRTSNADVDIPVEPNTVYGLRSDGAESISVQRNPVYGLTKNGPSNENSEYDDIILNSNT